MKTTVTTPTYVPVTLTVEYDNIGVARQEIPWWLRKVIIKEPKQ